MPERAHYRRVYPDRNFWAMVRVTTDKSQPAKLKPTTTRILSPEVYQSVVEPLATQVSQDLTELPTSDTRGDIAPSKKFSRRNGSW